MSDEVDSATNGDIEPKSGLSQEKVCSPNFKLANNPDLAHQIALNPTK